VDRIKSNRETVLSVLDGETGNLTCSRTESETPAEDTPPGAGRPAEPDVRTSEPSPADGAAGEAGGPSPEPSTAPTTGTSDDAPPGPPEGLDIGGAMGGESEVTASADSDPEPTPGAREAPPGGDPRVDAGGEADEASTEDPGATAAPDGVDRRVVRITGEVGDIYGVDGRTYDLSSDDVVDLPEENASILVGQDNAEPLE
jgi:DNA replication factor GINS